MKVQGSTALMRASTVSNSHAPGISANLASILTLHGVQDVPGPATVPDQNAINCNSGPGIVVGQGSMAAENLSSVTINGNRKSELSGTGGAWSTLGAAATRTLL